MRLQKSLVPPLTRTCKIVSPAGLRGGSIQRLLQSRWSSSDPFAELFNAAEPWKPPQIIRTGFTQSPPWKSHSVEKDDLPLKYDSQDAREMSGVESLPAQKSEKLGYMTEEVLKRWGRDRLPRDMEITDPWINLIQNNEPPVKTRTKDAIRRITPEKSLRMIEHFEPPDPNVKGSKPKLALCKLVVKREEYQHLKSVRTRRIFERPPDPKILTITWNIGARDLEVKLKKLIKFLGKGCKVDLQIYHKKNGLPPSMEQAIELVKVLRSRVVDEGYRESKCDGVVMGTMLLTFTPNQNYMNPDNPDYRPRKSPRAQKFQKVLDSWTAQNFDETVENEER
ncbi:hypothetical protein CP533_2820 [Ophiocordyceps camponoti-saundersi (nom. inval.)]|nr:hypothetical protein CP533_2820 [Ophiocordyceps camponoti-saundersi (nom. inval.)]